jgi:hypothetical protein
MVDGFVRCGICDQDFTSQEEWNEHAKGDRHQKLITIWRILEMEARASNHHFLMKEEMVEARRLVDKENITVEQIGDRLRVVLEKLADKKEKEQKE